MAPRRRRSPRLSLALFLILAILVMGGVLLWLSRVPLEPPTRLINEPLPRSIFDGQDVEPS